MSCLCGGCEEGERREEEGVNIFFINIELIYILIFDLTKLCLFKS